MYKSVIFIRLYCLESVRLVNGNGPHEGRVEIYYKCFWGTICGYEREWTLRDADVICRQLGYPSAIQAWANSHFGRGPGSILLSNVACNGSESSIEECSHSGWFDTRNCDDDVVGVTCSTDHRTIQVLPGEISSFSSSTNTCLKLKMTS